MAGMVRNLMGFASGAAVTVSLTQGAYTATGSTGAGGWGVAPPSGTVAILADRTMAQVAPDSVRFSVDQATVREVFTGVAPVASGGFYDPALHDLVYLWDMGATENDNWVAPENVLPAWKLRRYAKGPWVSHVFRTAGDKTVSVLIVDPATGATATGALTVTVRDPDVYYSASNAWGISGGRTVCINPVGDNDFTGAPAGAQTIQLDRLVGIIGNAALTAEWETNQRLTAGDTTKGPIRYLFKRGGTYGLAVRLVTAPDGRRDQPHIYFGDYGSQLEDAPIITPVTDITYDYGLRMFDVTSQYAVTISPTSSPDIRIVNLDIRGGFDPTLRTTNAPLSTDAAYFCYIDRSSHIVMSGCSVKGFFASWLRVNMTGDNETSDTPCHVHVDDTSATDLGGQYPIFTARQVRESSISFTGCRIMQNPDAYSGDDTVGMRALCRTEDFLNTHIRGCDFFTNTRANAGLSINKSPARDGLVVNIHSCSFEGDMTCTDLAADTRAAPNLRRSPAFNAIYDGIAIVGSAETATLLQFNATGVTVRNSLFLISTAPPAPSREFYYGVLVNIVERPDGGVSVPSYVFDAPVQVYNNTFSYSRSQAANNGRTPLLHLVDGERGADYSGLVFQNNVISGAWDGVADPDAFAPLSANVLWTPRYKGLRLASDFILLTAYETPSSAVKDYAPQAGSAALGTALSGLVSLLDLLGRIRPGTLHPDATAGTPSAGALEPA